MENPTTCKEEHKINAVIMAENEENAAKAAEIFSHTKVNESDLWHEHHKGMDIYTSLRWPNCIVTSSPTGATDILFVYLSQKGDQWELIKNYVDQRREIPYKFLISDNNELAKEAEELDMEFLKYFQFKNPKWKEKLFKAVLREDHVLRGLFNQIDKDRCGSIDEKEIVNLSKLLNHPMNDEDAKEIIKLLSVEGRIHYNRFKEWWIMGRSDFYSFRKLCQIEFFLNNFIKSTDELDNYIRRGIDEGSMSLIKPKVTARMNIKPEKDFDSQFSANWHVAMGEEYQEICNAFPEHINTSAFTVGREFFLHNAINGPELIKDLNEIKDKLLKEKTTLSWLVEKGLKINFRHSGSSVFVDFSAHGSLADFIDRYFFNKSYAYLNVTGEMDMHICSKASLSEILQSSIKQLLPQLLNLKIEGKAEYYQQKAINLFLEFFISYSQENNILKIISRFFTTMRNFDLDFLYSSTKLEDIFNDLCKEYKIDITSILEKHKTEFINNFTYILNQVTNLVSPKTLTLINPNLFSFYSVIPHVEIYAKTNIIANDMDKILNKMYKEKTL